MNSMESKGKNIDFFWTNSFLFFSIIKGTLINSYANLLNFNSETHISRAIQPSNAYIQKNQLYKLLKRI